MTPDGPPAYVVPVNLSRDVNDVLQRPFSEFQRNVTPRSETGAVDTSRVVVIGSFGLAESVEQALSKIITTSSVSKVLCVFCRPAGPQATPELVLPAVLNHMKVAVIWVDDQRGVVWDPDRLAAPAPTTFDQDPLGTNTLAMMLACLQLPEVFDDVFTKTRAAAVPVSPALRLLVPMTTGPTFTHDIARQVAQSMASDSRPEIMVDIADSLPADIGARLLGNAPVPRDFLDSTSEAAQLSDSSGTQVNKARQQINAIKERVPSRYQPVQAATRDTRLAGQMLLQLKTKFAYICSLINCPDGLDEYSAQQIRALGFRIELVASRDNSREQGHQDALKNTVVQAVQDGAALSQIADSLQEVRSMTVPRSPADAQEAIEEVCPNGMIQRLCQCPPLRVEWARWQVLILILFLFLASGYMPLSWAALPPALFLCLRLATGWVTYPRDELRGSALKPDGQATRRRRRRSPAVAQAETNILIGVVGFGAGYGLNRLHSSGGWQVVAALAAAVLLAALALYPWRASAAKWSPDSTLRQATKASSQLTATASSIAVNDWALAATRARFAATVGRLKTCIGDIRAGLSAEAAGGQAAGDTASAEQDVLAVPCNPAVRTDLAAARNSDSYQRVATQIARRNYIDIVVDIIASRWVDITEDSPAATVGQTRQAVAEQLAEYHRKLGRAGLFGMGTGADQQHREFFNNLWKGVDLAVVPSTHMVQLCSPESILLLDQNPASTRLIRFAPDGPAVTGGSADLVRTRSMLMAGTIRLVPVRVPVRWERPARPGQPPAPPRPTH
jgi:hypothetical protein